MATDDELLDELAAALHPGDRQPPADRIAALRAAAEDRATAAPTTRPAVVAHRRGRRIAPFVAAAAAVVVAFVLGGALLDEDDPPEDLLAGGELEFEADLVAPGGGGTATATGVLSGIGRTVQLRSDDLPILPQGEFYELWFVGPGDSPDSPNRISAGTFHPDERGRSHVDLTAAVNPELYPELSVTAEPGDGNPAPTGPEVLRAEIVLED